MHTIQYTYINFFRDKVQQYHHRGSVVLVDLHCTVGMISASISFHLQCSTAYLLIIIGKAGLYSKNTCNVSMLRPRIIKKYMKIRLTRYLLIQILVT